MKKIVCFLLNILFCFECFAASSISFNEWKKTFELQALKSNISQNTLDRYFANVVYLPDVIESDRRQPEFTLTFSNYMQKMITDTRIKQARQLWYEHHDLLTKTAQKYGVPVQYLLAFWGLETNFGKNKGQTPIVSALATLAYDERRSEFFTEQLLKMLHILQKQQIQAPNSSWAGAFGHFQFMPSTFWSYAVDENQDGKIDIYDDFEDAVGSAANYLAHMGWQRSVRWGRQVRLTDVKVSEHLNEYHSLSEWMQMGIVPMDGQKLVSDTDMQAQLLLPQGAEGCAFLVYKNFNVIKKWNNSDFYALAVGVLADKIAGYDAFDVHKIKKDTAFNRAQIKSVQHSLAQQGFYQGKIDGSLGKKTKKALQEYQKQNQMLPDGFLSDTLFKMIVSNEGKKNE